MSTKLLIRPYQGDDEQQVIDLWFRCHLVSPTNNPQRDIARKLQVNPELFLVGIIAEQIVATCMAGYEGHRGWINYLAVDPDYQHQGIGTHVMAVAEAKLAERGCAKINLMVRAANSEVITFYTRLGFVQDAVVCMGKRLEHDPPYPHSE
ncbi:GNAT family acetyltransferase [candidate division KSB3 bacterium]|uniref:GNAT family acetyltransferase n=1 Tax=candidate division KSB3 bacterium TaxID=2044937 RepID=A0A9D5Q6A6_9BACT|nr:GNAT family acetyltransferase [candidate division KSB3 bacterium]MBD3324721.1 GNAT family acetyltransferase [candidate division KSB3 bacterium]